MRLQDLAIIVNVPLDTDNVLLEKFKSHDRVLHDPKTDLYSYRVCSSALKGSSYKLMVTSRSMTTMSATRPPF